MIYLHANAPSAERVEPKQIDLLISPDWVPQGAAEPAGIGFMSRQKRESRSRTESASNLGQITPVEIAFLFRALICGQTAPLVLVLRTAFNRAATKFLPKDQPQRNAQLVFTALRPGLPPNYTGRSQAYGVFGIPVSPRSSLPLVPIPVHLRATL
jgi:hypothetical protein